MIVARSTRVLAWIAVVVFVASWLLPVTSGVPGWNAFLSVLSKAIPAHDNTDAIPQLLSALTNVAFIVLAVRLLRNRVPRPGLFLRIAIACFVLDLYWLVQAVRESLVKDLRIGYYAWLAAFALLIVIGGMLVREARRASAA